MQLDKPKFCRDCHHYRPAPYVRGVLFGDDMCTSPQLEPDLVTGYGSMHPSMARAADEYCSKDAKWFEVKTPPVIPQPGGVQLICADKRPWWRIWG